MQDRISGNTDSLQLTAPADPPSINLPKGGGAVRGIGEKFGANPVTGTGSMSVPIATSPGRSGFGPQLSLSYSSGAGNGPFGFGWNLSVPSITRKTDKGLPKYQDATESDVFLLSETEDLVPMLKDDQTRFEEDVELEGRAYRVHRYRPRVEGLFARIERWTRRDGDVHWRSISKDNILTIYGSNVDSRIAAPDDQERIFSWLIRETRDDKGNAILYDYRREDGTGVDLSQAHERNRGGVNDPRRASNRYLKRIRYGNREPLLDEMGRRPQLLTDAQREGVGWMFDLVFDYGEHDSAAPRPTDSGRWDYRDDPFSSYRAGFEVRTTRLCRRVLMFHHFPEEAGVGSDCLVRSTDFTYSHEQDPVNARNSIYTFLHAVTQIGYKRKGAGYIKRALPPVEFEYTQPVVQNQVEEVDAESAENLPVGLDGGLYRWTDLHGEGIPGILTEQADTWLYKRNLSPASDRPVELAPIERVSLRPNLDLSAGAQLMDLAGDGQPDLVVLDGPAPGLYEHDGNEGWQPFRPFTHRLNRDTGDRNLKLVDLDGDGHADVLITEDQAFVWHASLAEQGFAPARRVAQALDEEQGPRLVFDDGTQSVYLADLSGDGLSDLVRIRNGEVCYWPNLGYGRFGSKVAMDHSPQFDAPFLFDHKRIRLADIDGTGTTDIIYLHRDGVRLYFNQSGNSWSGPRVLDVFPRVDDMVSITPTDLLGNGTACLVWSSPLPRDSGRPMRYVNLMGGQKPHLLVKTINNLGAETRVHYAPSTKFYLQDKQAGNPWITHLPFPVHVVEHVEIYDHISRNRFVTRYAYHHGYFDGVEREFRGFGMVEQWDTEEIAALTGNAPLTDATNIDGASHVPPVHTKTWFHTGFYLDRQHISRQFENEYYREPGLNDQDFRRSLLPDTRLPTGLTAEEEREACRALKGMMLRQEVYADDAPPGSPEKTMRRAATPYTLVEQSFAIRNLQRRADNRHGVFFAHPAEALTYHYERNPADPRIQHALTLEADEFGNVLRAATVGYGRHQLDAELPLQADRDKQARTLVSYTESRFTHSIETDFDHRTPLPCEASTYELTGLTPANDASRFSVEEWIRNDFNLPGSATEISYERPADKILTQKRLIERVRTLFRKDNLDGLLPLGEVEPMFLPGETYKLAFTPGLLTQVFERDGNPLLPDAAFALKGQGADQGGYVQSQDLKDAGTFPDTDPDDHWWMPSGRVYLSDHATHTPADEFDHARRHFFLPRRYQDPFGHSTRVTYDSYDLLMLETRDALGNHVTVGERDEAGNVATQGNDYRVLQPRQVMDPNGNRTRAAFDALGMVIGTATMGKLQEGLGDSLDGFNPDLTEAEILDHLENPLAGPYAILGRASTRLVYDLFAYQRTKDQPEPHPATVYALARETHDADLENGDQTRVQHGFSYSDGFGREIQKKIQAEPERINGVTGPPRWIGSGWIVFNNKGKPVRQYEPFFSTTHRFELGMEIGVSPVLFYDPLGRVVGTLHPNHTYEKVKFDPWRRITWDANDTVLADPRTDPDAGGYMHGYFQTQPADWETWHGQRKDGAFGPQEQVAAAKTAAHAETSTTSHFDTLGRPFLTMAHNRVVCPDHDLDGTEEQLHTRVELDIEGNQRAVRDASTQAVDAGGNEVIDAQGRVVMRYDYDMLGNRIHQLSMEAGARWMLNDVTGNPIRAWNSRSHCFRTAYDPLRRPLRTYVTGADPSDPGAELLTERLVYGEQHPEATHRNLRGKPYLHLDQAGVVTSEAHDFKGNPLRTSRRLAREYRRVLDWGPVDAVLPTDATVHLNEEDLEIVLASRLEADAYTSSTGFDALNRSVRITTPHTPLMHPSVIRPGYSEANLLERVDVVLRGATVSGQPLWTPFVTNIDYDAKGQRQRIDYGNGASSFYEYDPLTFRLEHLLTRRNAVVYPDDCPNPPPLGWPGCQVQNLLYTYDPVGNIIQIRDDAQQSVYFRNRRVDPTAEYTYDAVYRLIQATGREHLGQVGGAPVPHSHNDAPRVGLLHPGDGNAMGRYIERYVYDAVGNFLEMQHRGADPDHSGWTRSYSYEEPSLIEDGTDGGLRKHSNRLSMTEVGISTPITERYEYDAHGSMIDMSHLPLMRWDYLDQLQATSRQTFQDGRPEITYYVYDAAGQRVRKVSERLAPAGKTPTRKSERIYLGGFEIYRSFEADGDAIALERETLHVMDDKQRIALVETRTDGTDSMPQEFIRYQFGNHLGSVNLELGGQAQIISREEYSPYGSTSYRAARILTEAPNRYRHTGKERDEESGLYNHKLRLYAPWLGRWTLSDPRFLADGLNVYSYTRNNPILLMDPDGTQSAQGYLQSYTYEAGIQTYMGALFEFVIGGSATDFNDKPRLPEGGPGGVVGGYFDTLTLGLAPTENKPSNLSAAGMYIGARIVPVIAPAKELVTGKQASGRPADRGAAALELGFDVFAIVLVPRVGGAQSGSKSSRTIASRPSSEMTPAQAFRVEEDLVDAELYSVIHALEGSGAATTPAAQRIAEMLRRGEFELEFVPLGRIYDEGGTLLGGFRAEEQIAGVSILEGRALKSTVVHEGTHARLHSLGKTQEAGGRVSIGVEEYTALWNESKYVEALTGRPLFESSDDIWRFIEKEYGYARPPRTNTASASE